MRPTNFSSQDITTLLRKQKIATMPEVKAALGTSVRRTVFRKLRELSYRSSYSHCGSYYTLDEIAQFDELGLWFFQDICFSIYGTLLSTAAAIVETSEYGCFVDELDNVLRVGTKDAMRKLVRDERLARERIDGRFLYCSSDADVRRLQLLARRIRLGDPGVTGPMPDAQIMPDELRAASVLFFSLLNEKQRRLYAGLEALKTGHGGDARIAALLGLDVGTVARGRGELLAQDVDIDRVRRAGGGRKPVEKKRQK